MNARIRKEEFLDLVEKQRHAKKATAPCIKKQRLREELELAIEESGVEITVLPGTQFKKRPPRSTAESKNQNGVTWLQKKTISPVVQS